MISPLRGLLVAGGLVAAGGLVTATSSAHSAADAYVAGSDATAHASGAPAARNGPAAVSADTLTTLEGVFTEEQARAGKQVYDMECALCHGPTEFAGRIFQITWTNQPLSSLYRHISLTMPLDNPGGLGRDQYVAVLAYILELNGYPAGEMELPGSIEELDGIRMERIPDPTASRPTGAIPTH